MGHSFGFALRSAPGVLRHTRKWGPLLCSRFSTREISAVETTLRFGDYELVLPDNPTIPGTGHITPNYVPNHIICPPYASALRHWTYGGDREKKLSLGGEEEARMRNACRVAKETLAFAKGLVKVNSRLSQGLTVSL